MESNQTNQPANSEGGARRPQFRRETPEYLARQRQPRTSNSPAEKSWGRVIAEAAVSGTVRVTAGEVARLLCAAIRDAVTEWLGVS